VGDFITSSDVVHLMDYRYIHLVKDINDTMVELKDIGIAKGGKQILHDISFKIPDNEFIAITGPNGSGKSTLAKIIMGIDKPDTGSILLDGVDITGLSMVERAKKGIAFAFQTPVTFKGITVRRLMELASGKKLEKSEVCTFLSKVGLCANNYLTREVDSSLSGGELKRIEIASVLARKARVSIFDEPEAGIDLWSFKNLIEVFGELRSEVEGSIVVISHQERILNIADRVVLLENGTIDKVVKQGEKNSLFTDELRCCKC
jgi:Fe-S cluster assembly ATP-binding protein